MKLEIHIVRNLHSGKLPSYFRVYYFGLQGMIALPVELFSLFIYGAVRRFLPASQEMFTTLWPFGGRVW